MTLNGIIDDYLMRQTVCNPIVNLYILRLTFIQNCIKLYKTVCRYEPIEYSDWFSEEWRLCNGGGSAMV
jgi:hypothetical protein